MRAADCLELKAFRRRSVRPSQPFLVVHIHVADDYAGNTVLRQALELLVETNDGFHRIVFARSSIPSSKQDGSAICVYLVPTAFIHIRILNMDDRKLEPVPGK